MTCERCIRRERTISRSISAAVLAAGLLVLVGCTRDGGTSGSGSRCSACVDESARSDGQGGHPDATAFDHSVYNSLLREHVNEAGFVDYKGLAARADQLDHYIDALADAPLDEMAGSERLALLINAYNAFTLRLILDHYPVNSIKAITPDPWSEKRWNVGGNVWSLNQIEHDQIRPLFKDPRVHFALVCAADGCPVLRNEAYIGSQLERQLERQAVSVHTNSRWFQYDAETNTLRLSKWYDWYANDFEQDAGSVLDYAARYSEQLRAALEGNTPPDVRFIEYDWSLNSQEPRDDNR